jgi:glycerol-3-phosphate dehydrogenase
VLRASERRPGRRDARGVSAPHSGEGSSLNAARRTRELEWLAGSSVHLVAGGGGITGLGVALDAASRGSQSPCSSARPPIGDEALSSKLIHGGFANSRRGGPGLAWERARERAALLAIAPHLVRLLPTLTPLFDRPPRGMKRATSFLWWAGNLMRAAARTSRLLLPAPREISPPEAQALVPGVRNRGLRGALSSWDAQLETTRGS